MVVSIVLGQMIHARTKEILHNSQLNGGTNDGTGPLSRKTSQQVAA